MTRATVYGTPKPGTATQWPCDLNSRTTVLSTLMWLTVHDINFPVQGSARRVLHIILAGGRPILRFPPRPRARVKPLPEVLVFLRPSTSIGRGGSCPHCSLPGNRFPSHDAGFRRTSRRATHVPRWFGGNDGSVSHARDAFKGGVNGQGFVLIQLPGGLPALPLPPVTSCRSNRRSRIGATRPRR